MSLVDPDGLEKLFTTSGISQEAAQKLREANNGPTDGSAKQPRGHGLPRESVTDLGEL